MMDFHCAQKYSGSLLQLDFSRAFSGMFCGDSIGIFVTILIYHCIFR